ncbi:MAG: ABC transporter substrate-binding protein [Actinomycetota bacterium]
MFRPSKRPLGHLRHVIVAVGLTLLAACSNGGDDAAFEPADSATESTETDTDATVADDTGARTAEQPGADEPDERDETAAPDAASAAESEPAAVEPDQPDVTTTEATSATDEPVPAPVELPPLFEGEQVAVVGSFDVWPNVGTLFEVGVVPATIIRSEGSMPPPDYFVEEYGDQLDQVGTDLLAGLNIEVILAQNADRLILQKTWEDAIPADVIELLGGSDNVLFLDDLDWRAALTQVAGLAGVDPAEVLAPFEIEYRARLDKILAAIDHDPADVTFSTFTWSTDTVATSNHTTIARAAADLGYQLNEAAFSADVTTVSFERVLDLDADVVLIQDNVGVGLDEIAQHPVWSLSEAVRSGNVFERFAYGSGSWIETMALLDDLEVYLTQYDAN